jgi:hypothetical protein
MGPLPPLSEAADDRRRRLEPPVELVVIQVGSTIDLPGRLGREPLILHTLVIHALQEVEVATRGKCSGDTVDFYDSIYEALEPYDKSAVDLREAEYEMAAAFLAIRALPYVQKEELEVRRLATLLAEARAAGQWGRERREAESLSHSIFNRASSGQPAFAIAAAASARGYEALERVCQHVFRAVVEAETTHDGAWREPLLTLAMSLSVSRA